MTSYCALLRGISPSNPSMRNDKLRGVFTGLGLREVASVISSGNIVFRAEGREDPELLEKRIRSALVKELGIEGGTILRSRAELQELVDRAPFGDRVHTKSTYLTATFLKAPLDPVPEPFPQPDWEAVHVLGYDPPARAVLAVTDTIDFRTPDYMSWLERRFGNDITTRTWLTVTRILGKLPEERPGPSARAD